MADLDTARLKKPGATEAQPLARSHGNHPTEQHTGRSEVRFGRSAFPWNLVERLRARRREFFERRVLTASEYFDRDWYLRQYPDVEKRGFDPALHYLRQGAAERLNPGPNFDTAWYLAEYPDVAAAGANPLAHYEQHGRAEGRYPNSRNGRWWTATHGALTDQASRAFRRWIEKYDYKSGCDRERYAEEVRRLRRTPLISVLMPVYNAPERFLRAAIESVFKQIYPHWELCIADDASTDPNVRDILRCYERREFRIRVMYRPINGHISEATNSAFELATGEYVALLDQDDILREHALAEVALTLAKYPNAQIIYSDEDKIDADGSRRDAFFKPDFSPDLFWSQNYLNHLTVHRADNIRKVGGWRVGFEGSQDYDLNLRVIRDVGAANVVHVPKILYHWRAAAGSTAQRSTEKGYAQAAALRALNEHFSTIGLGARAVEVQGLPFYKTLHPIPSPEPLVSLIVPTKDGVEILRSCIDSILRKTAYKAFEILIVDNDSNEDATLRYLRHISREPNVRVIHYRRPFNYSAINNFAVRHAHGSIIGLINNDVEVIAPEWLAEMVTHACRPEVGCVGAKLYYPDDSIQHAGVVLGIGGVAGHSHKYFPRSHSGYFARLKLCHNVSAVTGACLVVRKHVYEAVGGLDEEFLPVAFNDVDFCLKVRAAGYLNVFTPFAELYHHESSSRGQDTTLEQQRRAWREVRVMQERWGSQLNDPYYSPNLTLEYENFTMRS